MRESFFWTLSICLALILVILVPFLVYVLSFGKAEKYYAIDTRAKSGW
jgi:hypothetical protein